jgi:hypothetical protein
MSKYQITADTLEFKQAMKWLLMHEKARHIKDILTINKDLKKLKDVELPDLPLDIWVNIH